MNITVDESQYGIADYVEKQSSQVFEHYNAGDGREPDNHKDNPDNCLLTGSSIMTGGGKALVCSVGSNTLLARRRNKEKIQLKQAKTFYEDKLEKSCF